MIYGVGTDIINIERVEQILNKNKDGFVHRVLSEHEQAPQSERLTKRGLVNTLTRGCSLNHTGVFGARKLCRIRLFRAKFLCSLIA
jgi:hypothetical protein